MNCLICNSDTRVVDSRLSSDGLGVRRRRECSSCGFRFSTVEEVELLGFVICKRNGNREGYDREKLSRGILRALEKRSYTDEEFKELIHDIERDLSSKKVHEVSSEELGDIVMNRLRKFDKVAYIRFASVYRQFDDVAAFQREVLEFGE